MCATKVGKKKEDEGKRVVDLLLRLSFLGKVCGRKEEAQIIISGNLAGRGNGGKEWWQWLCDDTEEEEEARKRGGFSRREEEKTEIEISRPDFFACAAGAMDFQSHFFLLPLPLLPPYRHKMMISTFSSS